jgi:hypothetical protein
LKKEGVIAEDNPNILVKPIPLQQKGHPALGLRLRRLKDYQARDLSTLKEEWVAELKTVPGPYSLEAERSLPFD